MTTTPQPLPAGGLQDPERPDLHHLLRVLLVLLADVRDGEPGVRVRAGALHAVVRRFLDGDHDDG